MNNRSLENIVKNFSTILVVILIAVLLLTNNRTNQIFQSIIIWLIMYIISFWCTRSIHMSLASSIILIIFISFVTCRGSFMENFEGEEQKPKIDTDENNHAENNGSDNNSNEDKEDNGEKNKSIDLNNKVKDTKNMIESLDNLIVNKNMDLKEDEVNGLDNSELDKMLQYSALDDKSEKQGNKNSDNKTSTLTPAQAQRETFHLIDTVKQLDDTIKSLGPTLTQGKELLKMFDKIKFA